jgi:hypothetical protein
LPLKEKKMIRDKYVERFHIIMASILVAIFGWCFFLFINVGWVTPTQTTYSIVESKRINSGSFSIIWIDSTPIFLSDSDSYYLQFKIKNTDVYCTVDKSFFDTVNIGEKIEVAYGFGRLDHSYQPVNVKLVKDK